VHGEWLYLAKNDGTHIILNFYFDFRSGQPYRRNLPSMQWPIEFSEFGGSSVDGTGHFFTPGHPKVRKGFCFDRFVRHLAVPCLLIAWNPRKPAGN